MIKATKGMVHHPIKNSLRYGSRTQDLARGSELDRHGILPSLIKQLTEAAMQAELDEYLDEEETSNHKNDKTP